MQIRAASEADLDAVFDLLAARDRAAFGAVEVERHHVAQGFVLPSRDRFAAVEGDALTGFAALQGSQQLEIAGSDDRTMSALLDAIEERAAERGFDGLSAIVVPEDRPFDALVHRSGFEHRGDVLRMWRALTEPVGEPSWPDGVAVRTYDPADSRAVQALLDAAYEWDDTHVPLPHDDWVQWMTGHDDFDPSLWLLAERDDELVGCALHWRETNGRGWVKDLAVQAGERGRGLGAALLTEAFRLYRARGANAVGLKVDAANPTGAVQLYERLGFVSDRRYGVWVKEL